jgi:hypothetical protein
MDVPAPSRVEATPGATKVVLVGVLVTTAAALAFVLSTGEKAGAILALLTALFVVRVAGQVFVLARRPAWLPPAGEWNLMPYRLLLPLQAALVGLMVALCVGARVPGLAAIAVPASFVYWGSMAARYAVRMARRPNQRWFGGTIPIVFHCVLAAFLFVLGMSNG